MKIELNQLERRILLAALNQAKDLTISPLEFTALTEKLEQQPNYAIKSFPNNAPLDAYFVLKMWVDKALAARPTFEQLLDNLKSLEQCPGSEDLPWLVRQNRGEIITIYYNKAIVLELMREED